MKKQKWIISICICFFLAGVIGTIWIFGKPESEQIEIVQDGKVVFQANLAEEEDQVMEFTFGGRRNTVEIKNHRIRVKSAECADQTCVHMEWLDSRAPIVCLPNHLVIQYTESTENTDAVVR